MPRRLLLAIAIGASAAAVPQPLTDAELFDPAVLHRIDLLVNSADWRALKENYLENVYYPADLRWRGMTVRNVGVRSRGLGSRSGTKPGLRVDFNRYAATQTFLGLKSVVLDNLVQDASGLRERVAMKIHERMGLPSPRETHAALFVNNTFAGVYGIVEPVDKIALRRFFGERDGDWEDDGYLFEFKWIRPYYFEYLGSDPGAYEPLFSARTHELEPLSTLYAPLEALTRAIGSVPDAAFVAAVSRYLDLDNLVRYLAIQAYTAELDGLAGYAGMNNFYLYRFEASTRSQLIPWDADTAFQDVSYPVLQGVEQNELLRRVMRIPELREAFFDALLATAASVSLPVNASGVSWLEQEIEDAQASIAPWMEADVLKPYANEQFRADVARLVDFARGRRAFVERDVAWQRTIAQPAGGGLARAVARVKFHGPVADVGFGPLPRR